MAADGSWESIASLGLLSTTALLDAFDVQGSERTEIEQSRRPESVLLKHPRMGCAVIRDNKPLLESRLEGCLLDGLTAAQWYAMLNGRVFFWPTVRRVETLLAAAAYRAASNLVLTINTAELVALYGSDITLSPINSGATRPFAWPRGSNTFQSIEAFDFEARRHRGRQAIAELAVNYSVPEIMRVTESVVRWNPDGTWEDVWRADP